MEEEIYRAKYFEDILLSIEDFYMKDRQLLMKPRKTHEQTISFRLAHYLSLRLEPKNCGFYIDCEYHGDIHNRDDERKEIFIDKELKKVRPDILFHDRDTRNRFAIEVKRYTMRDDYKKINGYIKHYHYHEGYCIYNIKERQVSLSLFFPGCPEKGLKQTYRYNETKNSLELIYTDDFEGVIVR